MVQAVAESKAGEPNWQNRTLFHGDNLPFLRAMNSESVDLIATDPPFNKGRDFHATPDSLAAGAKFQDRWSWERDVHEEWTDQIADDHPRLLSVIETARRAHSDGMGAFLCFMAVRLLAMRRVLKPTGSIYLHCDPTASHYLKAMMDAIFGWKNFRNEVIWKRATTVKGNFGQNSKFYGPATDTLLFYTVGNDYLFNQPFAPYSAEYIEKFYRHIEEGTGRRYALVSMTGPGGAAKGNPRYEVMGVTRYWRYSREKMEELIARDLVVQRNPGSVPRRKYYLDEGRGVAVQSLWDDVGTLHSSSAERVGYPTQKPLTLYERIIRTSSNEGDIVLDPFAGCATTCVAAEKLQRQWVGIDIWEKVYDIVIERLKDTTGLFGDVTFTAEPPERTDDGDTAAPFLRVKQRVKEPDGPRWTRAEMYAHLLDQHGPRCMGCDRAFDDPRYLELDHNTPRSDGGLNHISNRILLCGPCNRLKSNTFTLSGLRRENGKRGYMAG